MRGRSGLSIRHSHLVPASLGQCHQHDQIELSYLAKGRLTYCIADCQVLLPARTIAVFWAGFAHRITSMATARDFYWLHLPLEMFLEWRLPDRFRRAVLSGQVVMDAAPSRHPIDLALFRTWLKDLAPGSEDKRRPWVLLELEARLGRLADSNETLDTQPPASCTTLGSAQASSVARLAQYASEHYAERWRWQDAARCSGLSPHVARRCFAAVYGMTLHQYLLRLRIARAKQLLATADTKIVDVALESGFPTLSNFYRSFETETHRTPSAYRKSRNEGSAGSP